VDAYVLVRTEVRAAADASDEVGALEGVISAEAITGP
jgi:DNA-binding Lrp family transcriptional regulator